MADKGNAFHHAEMTLMMSLALDGMLSPEERAAFEAHLRVCPDRQVEWARWQRVDSLLAQAPMLSPAPGFSGRVLERVNRRGRRQQRLVRGALLLGGSLSVWALVLLAMAALTLLWVIRTPSVAIHGVQVFLQMMTAGGVLLKAMRLWLESMTSPSVLPLLVTYACVMLVLTALWGWLVRGRPRRAPGLLILIAGS